MMKIKHLYTIIKILLILIFSILVWFIGPEIQIDAWFPLKSIIVRITILAITLLMWPLKIIYKQLLSDTTEKKLVSSFFKFSLQKNSNLPSLKEFNNKVHDLILNLKKCQIINGKKTTPLHKLPWYLIVGPLHYGKTSIIENSGLTFPLFANDEKKLEIIKINGLSWFVTEQAVFLEYSRFQEELDWDSPDNNSAWLGILSVLKKYKKGKPINGLIVTIDMTSFLKDTDEERNKKIDGIRHYIKDLYEHLGIKLPVYAIVTKCDQVSGFLDFFGNLTAKEQDQVVGFTLPFAQLKAGNVREILILEYDRLIERLNERLVWLLNEEKDPYRRSRLCFFPQQLLLLKDVIIDSFVAALIPNKFYEIVEFRGVYFTSAMPQVNSRCDPLGSLIVKQFDVVPITQLEQIAPSNGYFLKNLYQDVIIPEAGIVNYSKHFKKLNRFKKIFIYTAAISIATIGTSLLIGGYYYNKSKALQIAKYLQGNDKINLISNSKSIVDILPALNTLYNALKIYNSDPKQWLLSYKIYKTPQIKNKLRESLEIEIQRLLLPKIAVRLESLLLLSIENENYLYELFKGYIVLGNPNKYPKEWLRKAILDDWNSDPEINQKQKVELTIFLDLLLKTPFTSVPLNTGLVDQTIDKILAIPLEKRVYNKIKEEIKFNTLPLFNLNDIANQDMKIFFSTSNALISTFFTKNGFFELYSPRLLAIVSTIRNDYSIISSEFNGKFSKENATINSLVDLVNKLYGVEYIQQWQKAVNTLFMIPFKNIDEIIHFINILKNEGSSFNKMLNMISENIRVINSIDKELETGAELIAFTTLKTNKNSDKAIEPSNIYLLLDNLNLSLTKINENKDKNSMSFMLAKTIMEGGQADPISNIVECAKKTPEPISSWYNTVALNSWALIMENTKHYLNQTWEKNILVNYNAIKGFYPFSQNSPLSISEHKFAELFAKDGNIIKFYNLYLKPFLDTTGHTWRWANQFNVSLGSSDSTAEAIQKLYNISQSFFPNANNQINFNFTIIPLTLSANAASVLLKIGDQSIVYRHGPQEEFVLTWPSKILSEQIVISFSDFQGKIYSKIYDGPWGLFRFINSGNLHPDVEPDHYQFSTKVSSYKANFIINMPNADKLFKTSLKDLKFPDEF